MAATYTLQLQQVEGELETGSQVGTEPELESSELAPKLDDASR